jgi:hypothetical protein
MIRRCEPLVPVLMVVLMAALAPGASRAGDDQPAMEKAKPMMKEEAEPKMEGSGETPCPCPGMWGHHREWMEHHGEMMEHRQQVAEEMAAHDQKLDDLVAKMEAASGSEKTEAMAAVIEELVAQHQQRREMARKHWPGMMPGMMHPPMGPWCPDKGMKGDCPCPMMEKCPHECPQGMMDEDEGESDQ